MLTTKQHTINFLKIALLLFFLGHYGSSTMFYHIHVVDGHLYSHSHFSVVDLSNKSIPEPTHSHTSNQFNLIQLYNHLTLTDNIELPEIPVPTIRYVLRSSIDQPTKIQPPSHKLFRLRAPPAC